MPIYSSGGSYDDTFDVLTNQRNYGGPEFATRDRFSQLLFDSPRSSTPPLLSYPVDLGNTEEYQFSIRFDIYETGGATLQQTRKTQNSIFDSIRTAAQNAEGGLSVTQFYDLAASSLGSITDTIGAAFGGPQGSGIANVNQLGKGRDSFVEEATGLGGLTEYKSSIYMYLPGAIAIGYKFEYEDADMGAMDILKGLRSLTETQSGSGAVAQAEIARKMGMSAIKVADNITELVGGKEGLQKMLSAQQRQVENPFVVHMFKNVGRRTFRFSFTMIPRSEEEASAISDITTMFRKYAHPKRSEGGRYLDFPAEFGITFLHRNKESIRMPKIRKCALTGISMTYGENTFTATKPDSKGMVNPTKITMELEFSELEILTQQSIEEQGA